MISVAQLHEKMNVLSANSMQFLYYFYSLLVVVHAQVNDGHYSAEDDAKVVPIVVPIVVVVVIACIVGCCWQGKKCPCNKEDKKPKPNNNPAPPRNQLSVEREKKSSYQASSVKRMDKTASPTPTYPSQPPPYTTAVNTGVIVIGKDRDLPGHNNHHSSKHDHSRSKRSDHSSGYQSRNTNYTDHHGRTRHNEEKYRVMDNRSARESSKSRHARDNEAYVESEARYVSRKQSHRQQHYYDRP